MTTDQAKKLRGLFGQLDATLKAAGGALDALVKVADMAGRILAEIGPELEKAERRALVAELAEEDDLAP